MRGSAVRVRRNTDSPPKPYSRGTQAVLDSADEVKDNRADRRRLRLLVLTSTFQSMVFRRPEDAHNEVQRVTRRADRSET